MSPTRKKDADANLTETERSVELWAETEPNLFSQEFYSLKTTLNIHDDEQLQVQMTLEAI